MGFFDTKAEQLAIKLIHQYTGQRVNPTVCVPCEASIAPDWKGYCLLTADSLFLVNKYGARGVQFEKLVATESWGQYPRGSNGFPTYRFGFRFIDNPTGFTIFSKTQSGGEELFDLLHPKFKSGI